VQGVLAADTGSGAALGSRDSAAAERSIAPAAGQAATSSAAPSSGGRGDDRGGGTALGGVLPSDPSIHVESFLTPRPASPDLSLQRADLGGSAGANRNPALLPLDIFTHGDGSRGGLPASGPLGSTEAMAATGLVATAGYVLLNTRTIAWLLTFVVSQPAWKQFDPLEVIYSWEDGEERPDGEEEESLLSLVE
jgi:hypothetical protein